MLNGDDRLRIGGLRTSLPLDEFVNKNVAQFSWVSHPVWGNRDDPRFDYEFYLHTGGFATPSVMQ